MVAKPSVNEDDLLWQALEALPEGVKGEIIGGMMYTQARPFASHQDIVGSLVGDLRNPFQRGRGGPGGWWILPEPGIQLPEAREFSPDVGGWRKERMPSRPAGPITIAPDWVCEVLSKGTRDHDISTKFDLYRRIGVTWIWLIDPLDRKLAVFHVDADGYAHEHGYWTGNEKARVQPFPEVEFDLAEWWG